MKKLTLAAAAFAGAAALVVVGGIVGRTPASAPPTEQESVASRLEQGIVQQQERLRRVPNDWRAWAGLSMSYLERARIGADPSYYAKADEAAQRSLTVHPQENVEGQVASGALANARHDFVTARAYALAALATNEFNADAYAVLADAETQLGNRIGATAAVQRLLDLRPGLSGYARASYDLELRGRTREAVDLMERALDAAVDRHDIAFCRTQLGDLALSAGDLVEASAQYRAGLAADPTSATLQRGQARVSALAGRTDDAVAGYAALARRAPTPGNLLEYAEVLRSTGRLDEAATQVRLAEAAHALFVGNGGVDGLTGAALAHALDRPEEAVAHAQAEWSRRQHVDVADAYGWALHGAGRDGEALPIARQALTDGGRSAMHLYHLGMIELALGDLAGAHAHLAEALAVNAHFSLLDAPTARRALAWLGSK